MASETFSCPECSALLRYSPNLQAGDEVQCPKCKAEFPVPEAGAPPARSREEVTGEPSPRRPRFSEPESEDISTTRRRDKSAFESDDYADEDVPKRPFTGDYSIDMNRWFNVAGKNYSAFFGPAIGFIVVAYLIMLVPSMIISGVGSVLSFQMAPRDEVRRLILNQALTQLPMMVLTVALTFPLFSGLTAVSLAQLKGRPWTFGDFFSGFRHWGSLAGVALASYVLGIFAYIPGIIIIALAAQSRVMPLVFVGIAAVFLGLAVVIFLQIRLLLFAPSIIFDRNLGAMEAMKGNWQLTRGHFWGLFGISLLMGLIAIGGALACLIGILFAIPYITLIVNAGYLLITDPRETEEYRVQYED